METKKKTIKKKGVVSCRNPDRDASEKHTETTERPKTIVLSRFFKKRIPKDDRTTKDIEMLKQWRIKRMKTTTDTSLCTEVVDGFGDRDTVHFLDADDQIFLSIPESVADGHSKAVEPAVKSDEVVDHFGVRDTVHFLDADDQILLSIPESVADGHSKAVEPAVKSDEVVDHFGVRDTVHFLDADDQIFLSIPESVADVHELLCDEDDDLFLNVPDVQHDHFTTDTQINTVNSASHDQHSIHIIDEENNDDHLFLSIQF